jgi:hypothetical protein
MASNTEDSSGAPAKGSALATTGPKAAADPNAAQVADKTKVIIVERDGVKYEAAATDPGDGPHGMNHPTIAGEVGGGNIKAVLAPPTTPEVIHNPLTKEREALLSPVGLKLAGVVGRPISEWGLLGEGDVVKGHMLLLDLHTGEKVRGQDQHKIGEGKLYANLRNFPEGLTTGDTIEKILGG